MGPGRRPVGSSPALGAENIAIGAEPAPTVDDEKGRFCTLCPLDGQLNGPRRPPPLASRSYWSVYGGWGRYSGAWGSSGGYSSIFSLRRCRSTPPIRGSWRALYPMYAAFSVLRPSHNNQPLVESDFRRERPGEGRLVGLHGQIFLNFDRWRWPCGGRK
jgi:hypothetical protein